MATLLANCPVNHVTHNERSNSPYNKLCYTMTRSVPGDDILVSALNGRCLGMIGSNQLVFECCNGLDTFLLESLQASIESLLLCQQGLHAGQVTTIVIRVHLRTL